jgi:hypothetical protein
MSGGDYQTPATGSFTIGDDTIAFKAGRTIDGTALNGLDVQVVLDAATAAWAEYDAPTRTLIVHALETATTADVAATLGTLFNVYDAVSSGSAPVNLSADFDNVTTGGNLNQAASGSFDLNGDTITFSAGRGDRRST